ncbi:MAG TPA: hypothetical protein VIK39_20215 [Candidatus Angelobacter sp.]
MESYNKNKKTCKKNRAMPKIAYNHAHSFGRGGRQECDRLLGVCAPELCGLGTGDWWSDVDWGRMQISVERSIYHQRINDNCKTGGIAKASSLG